MLNVFVNEKNEKRSLQPTIHLLDTKHSFVICLIKIKHSRMKLNVLGYKLTKKDSQMAKQMLGLKFAKNLTRSSHTVTKMDIIKVSKMAVLKHLQRSSMIA